MIAGWDAARQENPQARQIMLAYRRDDVRDLNERARAVRQAAGELGESYRVATERGARDFAAGDRVYFLRNERGLGVKNGTLGTVERDRGACAGPGRPADGAAGRWPVGRLRREGLRAYRPRLCGDGAQEPGRDGGPDACAGDQPHGPARGLCRAEPAPGAGGPALECGRVGQPGAADPGARPRAAEGHQPGLRAGGGNARRNRRFDASRRPTRRGPMPSGAAWCRRARSCCASVRRRRSAPSRPSRGGGCSPG